MKKMERCEKEDSEKAFDAAAPCMIVTIFKTKNRRRKALQMDALLEP